MKTITLEDFKKAIKEKYKLEKVGSNAHFLLQPSRAKLRDLCFELFKENFNQADLNCFRAFMGFDFDTNASNKIKALTDKFRPLETFLKDETDLTDLAAINMVAILVDFSNRPYFKFAKMASVEIDLPNANSFLKFDEESNNPKKKLEDNTLQIQQGGISKKTFPIKKTFLFATPVLLILIGIFAYQKGNQKQCMQWNEDHYEKVNCKTEQTALYQSTEKIALNETLFMLRKINVCDTTVYFRNERPQIWYCKKGKQIEFFNGPGFHPENGKLLKPITNYMINKYVYQKEKIPN